MANHIKEISQRMAAIIAGSSYLIMFMVAILTEIFVNRNLIVYGDIVKTAHNIMANEMLFRIYICHFLIVFICDLLVAWALYIFFKQVNKELSLLSAWLRLVYTVIAGMALLNCIIVLHLQSGVEYLLVFEKDQLFAQILLYINAFNNSWLIGFVFFSIHMFVLGYLIFKSGYIPKVLGVLLIIVSLGFLVNTFTNFLLPNYKNFEAKFKIVISLSSMIGEMWLTIWLLLKGGKCSIKEEQSLNAFYIEGKEK